MSDKQFEKSLKLTKDALILSGIKIFNNRRNNALEHFINHYLYYCNLILLHTVILGETYWVLDGIQIGKPFVELCLTSPCITISILGTVKSINLYFSNGILVQLVEKLKEIHPELKHSKKLENNFEIKSKIIAESMKMLKFVSLLLTAVSVFTLTTFCFTPVLLTEYHHYRTGELVVKYPYLVKYFYFDVYFTEWWPLIYFHQVLATIIVTMNVFGSDTLLYALCVYISMHFRLLGLQFENIISSSREKTKRNLAKAVMRHQELIDMVNQTELLYSKSSLFNIVTSSVMICLSAFNIMVADEMNTIFAFISFLFMSLSQISILSFFADLLMRSSVEISSSIYKCAWYEADENVKKTIFLVIIRSQKACRLTAWNFADLNLRAFTTILSRSWSYFALLKTVYK